MSPVKTPEGGDKKTPKAPELETEQPPIDHPESTTELSQTPREIDAGEASEYTESPDQHVDETRTGVNRTLGRYADRHIGPSPEEIKSMLEYLGFDSLEALMDAVIPEEIRNSRMSGNLPEAVTEVSALKELQEIADRNEERRSYIGMGYSGTITPSVILRNILEDPGWLTAYTPYQAEISQGRLEALMNFQTMVTDLTGMEVANASLLDEGTAAAEAMAMTHRIKNGKRDKGIHKFFVASDCHPQTIELVKTRAKPMGIEVIVQDPDKLEPTADACGVLVQYPNTDGEVNNPEEICRKAKEKGVLTIMATDPLALTKLKSPGELDADIALGSTQRLGTPMGFGGPHAAYFATRKKYLRQMPGRLVGTTIDSHGKPVRRLAMGGREQHIRRERATSNICTSQVLLAVASSMYGVYHGPEGLKAITEQIHRLTKTLATGLKQLGYQVPDTQFFDTLKIPVPKEEQKRILDLADQEKINLRIHDDALGISIGEDTTLEDISDLLYIFHGKEQGIPRAQDLLASEDGDFEESMARGTKFMTHPIFNSHHSETEMLRYITKLRDMDVSLNRSMIPLGSCTMKNSGTSTMAPITWPKFANIHPFAPSEQTDGYHMMINDLEFWLAEITGFADVSLQPNAGSQGEYAGLLVIKEYHESREEGHRNVCLIPHTAHGTNPASATMAGMEFVEVDCDEKGNVNVDDLKAKAAKYKDNLAALMVTYPSTSGVFESGITDMCDIIHKHGGQVYMDGANMNAQVGYARPGEYGADVIHLNLHKTFGLPHGGGGPGVGPIGVAEHLAPHLPTHPIVKTGGEEGVGPISSAPWGSASILPIAWMYLKMMGPDGLKKATEVAILNANYISKRLKDEFPTLYTDENGLVAHECIIDPQQYLKSKGVTAEDIAKRLADFGWHAPTMGFPVPGTLMVEPTESETKAHLDKFIEAMIAIHREILAIEEIPEDAEDKKAAKKKRDNNPLHNAPHTADSLLQEDWDHPYSREQAAFPLDWVKDGKYWPPVGRADGTYGDRNPVLTLAAEEEMMKKTA